MEQETHWDKGKGFRSLIVIVAENGAVSFKRVQLLLGHTKKDSLVRYPGFGLGDVLAIAEAVEI